MKLASRLFSRLLLCTLFLILAASISTTIAQPVEVQANKKEPYGQYLTDGSGLTLYLFTEDQPGKSTCYDKCAEAWPPLLMQEDGDLVGDPPVNEDLLETLKREDGTIQVTYDGQPLYYYHDDKKPGDVKGQGKGDVWYLISPEGEAIEKGMKEEDMEH